MGQPKLYRKPNDPGFIGSYDWRSTVLGLMMITGFSFAATEYVAKQFQFQPALGSRCCALRLILFISHSRGRSGDGDTACRAIRGFKASRFSLAK